MVDYAAQPLKPAYPGTHLTEFVSYFILERHLRLLAHLRVGWTNTQTKTGSVLADVTSEARLVQGSVKWFDPAKGYGFVVADEGGADILLHVNVLRNFGQSSVADGSRIEVLAHRTDRGVQAVEVMDITPPDTDQVTELSDFAALDPDEVSQAPLEPARVKWFDKGKGFGFANIFGKAEDVFLHIEVLRRSGLADLQPGEALAMRVIDGRRGRMAAEVFSWEKATPYNEG